MNSLVRIGSVASAALALLVPSVASAHPSFHGGGGHYATPHYAEHYAPRYAPRYVAPRPYYAPRVHVAPRWEHGRYERGWRR